MSAQLALPEYDPSAGYILGPALTVSLVREGRGTVSGAVLAPAAAAAELLARVPDDGRERSGCVFLNVRREPTAIYTVSVGTLTASLVHPRELFAPAIAGLADALILWHTHPSGNPEPSAEDVSMTRRMVAAGALLGITVLDHLILAHGTRRWVSLQEKGQM